MKKSAYTLMAIAALALTACGGNKQEAQDTDTIQVTESVTVEEVALPDSETVVAVEETVAEAPAAAPVKKAQPATPAKAENKENKFQKAAGAQATVKEKAPEAATQQPVQRNENASAVRGAQQGFNQAAQAGEEKATGLKGRYK